MKCKICGKEIEGYSDANTHYYTDFLSVMANREVHNYHKSCYDKSIYESVIKDVAIDDNGKMTPEYFKAPQAEVAPQKAKKRNVGSKKVGDGVYKCNLCNDTTAHTHLDVPQEGKHANIEMQKYTDLMRRAHSVGDTEAKPSEENNTSATSSTCDKCGKSLSERLIYTWDRKSYCMDCSDDIIQNNAKLATEPPAESTAFSYCPKCVGVKGGNPKEVDKCKCEPEEIEVEVIEAVIEGVGATQTITRLSTDQQKINELVRDRKKLWETVNRLAKEIKLKGKSK